jgi:drug/metabolite transporter (DMT)-like permease
MPAFAFALPMPRSFAQQRALPYVLLLVSAASWGGNWVAARAVISEVSPFTLVFWRWSLAAAILLPFAAAQLRADAPLVRRHLAALCAFGIVGTAGFAMLGYWGVRYTTAINAALLNASLPLFIVPLSWLLLRLTVSARQIAGLSLSLGGVACILGRGDIGLLTQLSLNRGDLLLLGALLLWALYTVLLKWRPPLQPLSFLLVTIAAGAAFSAPFYAWDVVNNGPLVLSPKTLGAIAYLSVFPSIVAYVCWNYAVAAVGPNVAGFFNPLIPVFGTLFAIAILGEQFRSYHLVGFALVLLGVALTSRR